MEERERRDSTVSKSVHSVSVAWMFTSRRLCSRFIYTFYLFRHHRECSFLWPLVADARVHNRYTRAPNPATGLCRFFTHKYSNFLINVKLYFYIFNWLVLSIGFLCVRGWRRTTLDMHIGTCDAFYAYFIYWIYRIWDRVGLMVKSKEYSFSVYTSILVRWDIMGNGEC